MKSKKSRFHQWKLATINISTGSDDWRLEEAVRQISRSGLSICALQEVRRLEKGNTIIEFDGYKYEWNGPKRLRQQGVALVIRVDPNIII
jgi:exonuclease III